MCLFAWELVTRGGTHQVGLSGVGGPNKVCRRSSQWVEFDEKDGDRVFDGDVWVHLSQVGGLVV